MTPTRFFQVAVYLPLLVPLLALPYNHTAVGNILALSLMFGGLQYLIFAIALSFYFGSVKDVARIVRILLLTPFIFVPFQVCGFLLVVGPSEGWIVALFAVVALLLGYAYIVLIGALYVPYRFVFGVRKVSVRSPAQAEGVLPIEVVALACVPATIHFTLITSSPQSGPSGSVALIGLFAGAALLITGVCMALLHLARRRNVAGNLIALLFAAPPALILRGAVRHLFQ